MAEHTGMLMELRVSARQETGNASGVISGNSATAKVIGVANHAVAGLTFANHPLPGRASSSHTDTITGARPAYSKGGRW